MPSNYIRIINRKLIKYTYMSIKTNWETYLKKKVAHPWYLPKQCIETDQEYAAD